MEAEERPTKNRKLFHDSGDEHSEITSKDVQNDDHNNTYGSIQSTDQPKRRQRTPPPDGMSRNGYKKLKRQREWDAGKAERRAKEKEKKKEQKAAKRATAKEAGVLDEATPNQVLFQQRQASILVPVTIIIDCGFDELMVEAEVKSLGSQITRCYSDNAKAKYKVHLAVSSFNGRLRERFDTVLEKQHQKWRGVKFLEEGFANVAQQANEWMEDDGKKQIYSDSALAKRNASDEEEEPLKPKGEVIYLSSESDNTIEKLEPYCTYIIGGLVDRNRHKGICYKTAMDAGVKTARLPIGEFLEMDSRKVLTTNHVNEIMLSWLELGDWGEAFMKVIPKRKGGALKSQVEEGDSAKDESKGSTHETIKNITAKDDIKRSAELDALESEAEQNGGESGEQLDEH
jgi:tRNA (guanine9-N1)-methyltransferase